MSWASKRTASRVEDIAYSLLGLFDVYMPLLYGERERAFLRLQEEIIRSSDDQTIFVWQGPALAPSDAGPGMHGLLARSPVDFECSGNIIKPVLSSTGSGFSMTNRGIAITLSLRPWKIDTYLALLDVNEAVPHKRDYDVRAGVGLFLRRLYADDAYARVEVDGQQLFFLRAKPTDQFLVENEQITSLFLRKAVAVNILQTALPQSPQTFLQGRLYGFRLSGTLFFDSDSKPMFQIEDHWTCWSANERIVSVQNGAFPRMPRISVQGSETRIELGFDKTWNPTVFICERHGQLPEEVPQLFDLWNSKVDIKVMAYDVSNELSSRSWNVGDALDEDVEWHQHAYSRSEGLTTVYPNKEYPHIWLLKGHRNRGLDVYLSHESDAEPVTRHMARSELLQRVQLKHVVVSGQLVWEVTIDAISQTSDTTERMSHLFSVTSSIAAGLPHAPPATSITTGNTSPRFLFGNTRCQDFAFIFPESKIQQKS